MDIEELAARLSNLESARDADLQAQAQQAFMNKYGGRVGNNEKLGMVILNELNRRGIDTSAADEAVQQILDQLRMEATALLDTIQVDMAQANQLIDKVNSIDEAVSAAAAATGADTAEPSGQISPDQMSPAGSATSPDVMGLGADGDMPEGFVPEGGASPEDMPAQPLPPPPDGQAAPPPPAKPEMNPEEQVSDIRKKAVLKDMSNFKRIVSDARKKRIQQPVGNSLDANIIAACQGGF